MLKIKRDLTNTFLNHLGSYNLAIVSALDPQHLTYQWSNGMSYFFISSLAATPPPQSISALIKNIPYGKPG